MNNDLISPSHYRMRSGWNPAVFIMRGPLTDKKIASYERRGFYSPELREARRQLRDKKNRQILSPKRDGNFMTMPDGRLIYTS